MMARNIHHRKSGYSLRLYYCSSHACDASYLTHSTHTSFLASTHYTNYNPWLFAINLTALIVLAIIPKLPQVRRLRRYHLTFHLIPLVSKLLNIRT